MSELLPSGRPSIHLPELLEVRKASFADTRNPFAVASLRQPVDAHHASLVAGLRRMIPFMYKRHDEVVEILHRHGLDLPKGIPIPSSVRYQAVHLSEFVSCAYAEECEQLTILTYKWRLNTSPNQHQFGMDLLAFDLSSQPPIIHAISVKTTSQAQTGRTPSVVYDAIRELNDYLLGDGLANDLPIIAANLDTSPALRDLFLDWFDPYSQGVPGSQPTMVAVVALVIDHANWQDDFAKPVATAAFPTAGRAFTLAIARLADLVESAFRVD